MEAEIEGTQTWPALVHCEKVSMSRLEILCGLVTTEKQVLIHPSDSHEATRANAFSSGE